MNVKLTLAPEAFHLLTASDDNKVRIKILYATIFITQDELKPPPLFFSQPKVLEMKRKTNYPVTHTQIEIFTAQQVSIDNVFPGPKLCIRWFCKYKSIHLSSL